MKKQYLTVLFTLICVLGLGLGLVPRSKTQLLPTCRSTSWPEAGYFPRALYRVSRVDSTSGSRELEISSYETRASVFVIPTVFDDVQSGKAQLNFEHLEGAYFLNAIETPIGTYAIDIPPAAIKLAQMQQQGGSHSGGH